MHDRANSPRLRALAPSSAFALVGCLGAMCLMIAGCAAPGGVSREVIQHAQTIAHKKKIIGWSVDFDPMQVHVFGRGPEVVLFVGGQQGDVPAGAALLERLVEHLKANSRLAKGRTIVVLTAQNLDGLAVGRRGNRHGVDLNRNLPTRNWRPYPGTGPRASSEPETKALVQLLADFPPARIMNVRGPLNHVAFHGPAQYLGHQLARHIDYPIRPPRGFTPTGSLEGYASDQNWPIVTLELAQRKPWPTMWDEMSEGLEFFITREVTRSSSMTREPTIAPIR